MLARKFVPDRATLALAGAVGAAYLFLGASAPLALFTAFLVVFARGLLEAALSYRPMLRPARGTPEAMLIARAEAAVTSIRRLRASAGSGAIAYRCTVIAGQADDAVAILRRLAYQSGVVSRLAAMADLDELRRTDKSLRHQLSVLDEGPAHQQTEYALRSHTAVLAAAERLEATRRELFGRIETAALGLEELVARVAEVVARSEFGSGIAGPRVEELAAELDTLRAALIETEDLGRHALAEETQMGR